MQTFSKREETFKNDLLLFSKNMLLDYFVLASVYIKISFVKKKIGPQIHILSLLINCEVQVSECTCKDFANILHNVLSLSVSLARQPGPCRPKPGTEL